MGETTATRSSVPRADYRIDVVVDLKTTLGEGPLWDVDQQRLYWIDSMDGRIFRSDARGNGIRAWEVGQKIGSLAIHRSDDGAIVALQDGLSLLDFADGEVTSLVELEADLPDNRFNDGIADGAGRFVFGSLNSDERTPSAKLYSYTEGGQARVLDDDIIVSNGPCFSPDGGTLYFSDTWSGEIWAYDYDVATGDATNRRVFATVDTSYGGAADGATVDSEGFLWQAMVYGGKIARYAPDGSLDRTIDFPVLKPTSVMFGGPDLDILYVTSMARPPLPRFPGDGQLRGSLFAITGLGIEGLPEHRFGS